MNLEEARRRATLTIPEAAELLGLKRSAAYECARRGELPVLTLGRKKFVAAPRLLAMLGADPAVSNGLKSAAKPQVSAASPDSVTGDD